MLKKPSKVEINIIVAALVLSLATIAGFWGKNKMNSSNPVLSLPASESISSAETESSGSESDSEQKIVTTYGLSKILESGELHGIILGDSLASSEGASNKNTSSWYSRVAEDLKSKYPGTTEWNFITGKQFTANNILARLPELGTEYDVVLISLGRSDSRLLSLEEFRQKYGMIIKELQSKLPHADIYLIVEPPVQNVADNNQFFPYREIIHNLGKEYQLPVVDQWQAFIEDPAPLASLLVDGVHPNDAGYRIFAKTVINSFDEKLKSEE